MNLEESYEISFEIEVRDFAAAIELYIARPHLIDKRLSGSLIEDRYFTTKSLSEIIEETKSNQSDCNQDLNKEKYDSNDLLIPKVSNDKNLVIKRSLILKKKNTISSDLVIWTWNNPDTAEVNIIPEDDRDQKYSIRLVKKSQQLQLYCSKKSPKSWIKHILVKKLLKWSSEKLSDQALTGSSLKLISIDEYVKLYNDLKEKYFDAIAQAWDSESTNAEKFIHEDLGIATYLLLIWKKYDYPQPQSKGLVTKNMVFRITD